MALGTFIAGRYSATYDPIGTAAAADIGIMEDGYEVEVTHSKELIGPTDAYGDTIIDGVGRGVSGVFIGSTSLEYKNGLLAAAFPYSVLNFTSGANTFTATGVSFLGLGTVGRLDSDNAPWTSTAAPGWRSR